MFWLVSLEWLNFYYFLLLDGLWYYWLIRVLEWLVWGVMQELLQCWLVTMLWIHLYGNGWIVLLWVQRTQLCLSLPFLLEALQNPEKHINYCKTFNYCKTLLLELLRSHTTACYVISELIRSNYLNLQYSRQGQESHKFLLVPFPPTNKKGIFTKSNIIYYLACL